MKDAVSLDAIGILEGTNKSSLLADYLRHYERLFSHLRQQPFNLIEIGVQKGDSLRTWTRFFPKAQIVGIDISENCRQSESDRILIEIGSQTDPGLLARVCMQYPPTIIIDDGSHQARDVLFTFQTAFPFLLPGGFYAMEDLHFHYGALAETFRKNVAVSPSEYIFGIGHSLLSSIAHTPQSSTLSPVDNYGLAKYMFEHIDRIEVITSSVIISKRREGHTEESLNALWSLTEKSGRAENWFRLTNIFMRCKRYDKAIEAARRATVGDPKNAQYHYHHGLMMEHGGDVSGASEAMRQVLKFTTEQSFRSAAQSHLDRLAKSLKGEA